MCVFWDPAPGKGTRCALGSWGRIGSIYVWIYIYIYICIYIYIYIRNRACANGVPRVCLFVCVLCSPHYFSTFLLSYFPTMSTVGMFTVGFGMVCVRTPPPTTHTHSSPPWLRRVSRFGVIF